MTATSTIKRPVQLTLALVAPCSAPRHRAVARPFWAEVDLADLGGPLRARGRTVRVLLDAQRTEDGLWRGQYDALLSRSGVSGPTKLVPLRRDALTSAAHAVAAHCQRVIARGGHEPPSDVRAAKEVRRWLQLVDLL